MATVMDVRLKRSDKTFRPGETVSGLIVVQNKGVQSHNGITLSVEGVAQLQLSSKSVGAFQAFYESVKPITMLAISFEAAKPGKLFVPHHTSFILRTAHQTRKNTQTDRMESRRSRLSSSLRLQWDSSCSRRTMACL